MRLNRSLPFILSAALAAVMVSLVVCESTFAQRPDQDRGQRLQKLLQRLDKNKDQQLTRDEVPERMLERFAKMDLDGDGTLTSEEAKTVVQRMSNAGAASKKGKGKKGDAQKGGAKAEEANKGKAEKSRAKKGKAKKGKSQKGEAKKKGKSKNAKGEKKPVDIEANISRLMARMDKNEDGFITRDEAPKQLERNWQRFDTNGNDKLDGEELQTLRRMMRSQELDKKMKAKKKNRYDVESFGGVKPKKPGSGK